MKMITKMVPILLLAGCAFADPIFAQPPQAPGEAASVADTIKHRIREWVNEMMAVDVDQLNQIIADDWVDGYTGKTRTKASFIAALKSGAMKLQSCEFGPMDVKVLGNVAVIQGSVSETSLKDGKITTFQVAYMDVFEKRGDRWVVVRSHAKKI